GQLFLGFGRVDDVDVSAVTASTIIGGDSECSPGRGGNRLAVGACDQAGLLQGRVEAASSWLLAIENQAFLGPLGGQLTPDEVAGGGPFHDLVRGAPDGGGNLRCRCRGCRGDRGGFGILALGLENLGNFESLAVVVRGIRESAVVAGCVLAYQGEDGAVVLPSGAA